MCSIRVKKKDLEPNQQRSIEKWWRMERETSTQFAWTIRTAHEHTAFPFSNSSCWVHIYNSSNSVVWESSMDFEISVCVYNGERWCACGQTCVLAVWFCTTMYLVPFCRRSAGSTTASMYHWNAPLFCTLWGFGARNKLKWTRPDQAAHKIPLCGTHTLASASVE